MGNSIDIADMSRDLDNIKLVTAKMANINNQINQTVNNIKTKADALQKASAVYLQKLSDKVVKISSQVNNITKINVNQSVQTNTIISNIKNTLTNNITVELSFGGDCGCKCEDDDNEDGDDDDDNSWYKVLRKILKTIVEVIGFLADLITVWEFLLAKFPRLVRMLQLAVNAFIGLARFLWAGFRILGRVLNSSFRYAMRLVMSFGRFLIPIISSFGQVFFAFIAGLSWPVLAIIAAIIAIVALFFLYGDEIWAYLSDLWQRIKGWFGSLWNSLSSSASLLYNGFINGINSIWNYISSAGVTLYNYFINSISAIWNYISSAGATLYTNFINSITAIWNFLSSASESLYNSFISSISAIWTFLSSAGEALYNSLISSISAIWTFLSSAGSTLYNNLISSIAAIWNFFSGAGPTVISNFIKCLDNIWNSLKNAVKDFFSWGSSSSDSDEEAEKNRKHFEDMSNQMIKDLINVNQMPVSSVDPYSLVSPSANHYTINSSPNIVIHAQGLNDETIKLIKNTVSSGVMDGEKAITKSINGGAS